MLRMSSIFTKKLLYLVRLCLNRLSNTTSLFPPLSLLPLLFLPSPSVSFSLNSCTSKIIYRYLFHISQSPYLPLIHKYRISIIFIKFLSNGIGWRPLIEPISSWKQCHIYIGCFRLPVHSFHLRRINCKSAQTKVVKFKKIYLLILLVWP